MANNQDVTNNRNSFNANTNPDYTVETVDQGSGVQRQVVSIGDGTVDTITNPVTVQINNRANIDAFGRLRVSNPSTILDTKQIFDNQPLFWDDQEVSGSGTSSSHSTDTAMTTIGVSATTAGKRARQTFMRFNYEPGKSQLILMTGVLVSGGGAGITAAIGQFDDDNGLFFKYDEGTLKAVRRTSTSGSAVDNEVASSSFNIDPMDGTGPSGVTLDLSKTQIIFINYEWLGVGRAVMGFVVDGQFAPAHEFLNTNSLSLVYMSTPNLPLRYEIENDGTGQASTMGCICTSIMTEGGREDSGIVRGTSTSGTHVDANAANSVYAVIGIRLKSSHLGATVRPVRLTMISETNDDFEWMLMFNPTVAGTFTYNDVTNSAVQVAKGATANTITYSDDDRIDGGFSKSSSEAGALVVSSRALGSAIDGTRDTLVLAVRPLSASADIQATISWKELS